MKLCPCVHIILSAKLNTHGVGGVLAIDGTASLYCAGQPMVVRSKPELVGGRLYAKRLRLAFTPIMGVRVSQLVYPRAAALVEYFSEQRSAHRPVPSGSTGKSRTFQ